MIYKEQKIITLHASMMATEVKKMNVTIYTTSTCKFCEMTKALFRKHNVKYTEINVENNPKMQQEVLRKAGAPGVPVIDIDGQIIHGYDEKALKKALRISG